MSGIRDLFVSRVGVTPPTDARAAAPTAEEGNGEFITPQTLTTFAGATFAISVVSGVLLRLVPDLSDLWVGAAVAFVVGLILFWINVTDPRVRKKLTTSRDWALAVIVGLVNCFYLIAIAIGVFEAVEAATAGA